MNCGMSETQKIIGCGFVTARMKHFEKSPSPALSGTCTPGASITIFGGTFRQVLTEPVRRKPLISMGGKAHKVFEREVTLPYAPLHLFLHRRTSASCERSAESFSRKGV